MTRGKFLELISLAFASYFTPSHKLFADSLQSESRLKSYVPLSVALLEPIINERLEDVYILHSQAVQAFLKYSIEVMNKAPLPVQFYVLNAAAPSTTELSDLQAFKPDIFCVSSHADFDIKQSLKGATGEYKSFWKDQSTIGVFAAGNTGKEEIHTARLPFADFSHTSVMVGSAEPGWIEGEWEVSGFSPRTHYVSFVAPNISRVSLRKLLDGEDGFSTQLINSAPDLKPHKKLVIKKLKEWDLKPFKSETAELSNASSTSSEKSTLKFPIAYERSLEKRADEIIKNPELFHQEMLAQFKKNMPDLDIKTGVTSTIYGTSFCSPYVAAAFAVARFNLHFEKLSLSSEELLAIAYMSCDIKALRQDYFPGKTNGRGVPIGFAGVGFGLFTYERFQVSLQKAQMKLRTFPNLSRPPQTLQLWARKHKREEYQVHVPESDDLTILNLRLEYRGNRPPPNFFKVIAPSGKKYFLHMFHSGVGNSSAEAIYSWARNDLVFGESLAGTWRIAPENEQDNSKKLGSGEAALSLSIRGFAPGGLIDILLDEEFGSRS